MATNERPADRGQLQGRQLLTTLGLEIRIARRNRGLNQGAVARALTWTHSWVSRIERGLAQGASLLDLSRLCAVVGLELSAKAFPGGDPVRDGVHAGLLRDFRAHLHVALRWATEVPFPRHGDLRAWDALVDGLGWRYGVEAETAPDDAQATARRVLGRG